MDIRPLGNDQYLIDSETSERSYIVNAKGGCTCHSFQFRGGECKHMKALAAYLADRTALAKAADKAANMADRDLQRFARERVGTAAGAACLLELAVRQANRPEPKPIPAEIECFLVGATEAERERALAIYR